VGYAPETDLVKEIAKLNERGYIITDTSQKTSVEGLYAAGDICIKPLRQVVTATSDGALAATELEKYVAKVQERTGIRTQDPVVREKVLKGNAKAPSAKETSVEEDKRQGESSGESGDGIFDAQMRAQLETVFSRMENSLVLKVYPDERPVSQELQAYMEKLTAMTDKLTLQVVKDHQESYAPCVKLYRKDGSYTGLAFHGVPGGQEFTSFVLGMYNAAGPGQTIEEDIRKRIPELKNPMDIKLLVTLSCTMCPDLVVAAQHMAAISDKITTEVYDILHFEALKDKYNVMSVPCMVINDEQVHFGKKNMQQIIELLENKKE
jgi:thioredoxin reductase (NADPH)